MTPLEAARMTLQQLLDERRQLDQRIKSAEHAVQALCDHRWKLHQVVGDGRYCPLCGLDDPYYDD